MAYENIEWCHERNDGDVVNRSSWMKRMNINDGSVVEK